MQIDKENAEKRTFTPCTDGCIMKVWMVLYIQKAKFNNVPVRFHTYYILWLLSLPQSAFTYPDIVFLICLV